MCITYTERGVVCRPIVIIRVADGAHGRAHSRVSAALAERQARVLCAPIGVMHDSGRWPTIPHRHGERFHDEFGPQCVRHRPPHDTPAPGIQHRREIQPSFARRHIGDVRDPKLIGRGRRKITAHQIRRRHGLTTPSRRPPDAPSLSAGQAGIAHQPRDPLPPTPHALCLQLRVDPGRPRRAAALLMNGLDLGEEDLICLRPY